MIKKITVFILLSSIIFTPFIVSADIYLDNGTYVIDFNNNEYPNDDLLNDLMTDLIEYFEVETGAMYTTDNTDIINTNFDKVQINILNGIDNDEVDFLIYGFQIEVYINGGSLPYSFDYILMDGDFIATNPILTDYYVNIRFLPPPPPPPLFNDITLSITLLILLILTLGMYLIFKSNLILIPSIILWLVFIGNTNNDLIVLFATILFIITIVITFFKDKKGDAW